MADAMSHDDNISLDIVLEMEAPPEEVTAIQKVVDDAGISASVKPTYLRLSAEELPWLIFFLTPLWVFFRAFLEAAGAEIGKEVGREASQVMHQFILQLYNARKNPNGNMALWDPGTHSHVTLEQDLPEEAYRQLAQMGPELLEGHHWAWDHDQNQWTNG